MIPFCCIILCLSFILCLCVCLVLAHYFMILNDDVASFIWWCEPINYCSCLVIVCGGIDRARRDYCKVLVMNIVLESKWRQRLAVSQCLLQICWYVFDIWIHGHHCILHGHSIVSPPGEMWSRTPFLTLALMTRWSMVCRYVMLCMKIHPVRLSAWFQLLDLC